MNSCYILQISREKSIKCATRKERSRSHLHIRRVFEDGSVPLLKSWSNFPVFYENKADIARFFSEKLLAGAPANKIIIVGGGFEEEDKVKCSRMNIDIRALKGFHEEADTRMILHRCTIRCGISCRLMPRHRVFLLSLSHCDKMSYTQFI